MSYLELSRDHNPPHVPSMYIMPQNHTPDEETFIVIAVLPFSRNFRQLKITSVRRSKHITFVYFFNVSPVVE